MNEIEMSIKEDTLRDLLDIKGMSREMLRAVVTHPNIAIVDREAELPQNPYIALIFTGHGIKAESYQKAQQDMVKDHWVKEIVG